MTGGYPLALEKQYIRLTEKFIDELRREAVKTILENTEFGTLDPHLNKQAVNDGIADILRAFEKIQIKFEHSPLLGKLRKAAANVFESVSTWTNRYNSKMIEQAGFDPHVFKLPPVRPQDMRGVVEKNIKLIESQGKEYLGVIQKHVKEFVQQAKGPRELAKLIEQKTQATRNQARLIASDQLRKAHSDISQTSQKSAGFSEYIWRTQKDGRVRDDHASLEGLKFSYDDPPVTNSKTGDRNSPGGDYNCRCWAEPAFPDTPEDTPAQRIAAAIEMTKKRIAAGE